MKLPTLLIGIDCACQPENVGLARAELRDSRTTVTDVMRGSRQFSVAKQVAAWVNGCEWCLIALDAPLGWPMAVGEELVDHRAGGVLVTDPDDLFQRQTDRDIRGRFGKKPFEVGANLIARTAHSALLLLQEVRNITGRSIPLAWHATDSMSAGCIEVYPAVTLQAHAMPCKGYKDKGQRPVREDIVNHLSRLLALPVDTESMLDRDDCLDAVVCILAAADFMNGFAVPPADLPTAEKEGWIWVRDPVDQ